ncbi:hypothetical protein D1224_08210 [Henriciella barbarensis]|uniref:Uncharacterized protein n=1 Tax=Henriciella barbarensis TaxID=86342 RepID=A0A399R3B9_9PROT|nr:hypothetical protein [Henriciella barbarensis]RIJ24212.1 hypothetical protein D1224_08210 [Henriciella barbarensis]
MVHPLSRQLADTAKFTSTHAILVVETETSLPWLVTGAVLMVQQACVMALSEAGAELPAMPGPGELVARVSDAAFLEQPYTAPLRPEEHRAIERVIAARNDVMHPRPKGLSLDARALPEGLFTCTKLVRHLAITQPVRPSMMDGHDLVVIQDALGLIDTSADFWASVF